jgi:two-component system sensor kinase FixL
MEEIKEILNDILKENERAAGVINHLRVLLKKAKTEFEILDLNVLFREVIRLLHSNALMRDVRLVAELDPQPVCVSGDRIQLQQVALNWMLNAFEAMNDRPRGERRVLIRTGLKDSQILAAVTDSGKGISSEETEKLFKPFYTTKSHGLGMGLSISRSIINRHQGRIWVENDPDGGTTFFFSLPSATGAQI